MFATGVHELAVVFWGLQRNVFNAQFLFNLTFPSTNRWTWNKIDVCIANPVLSTFLSATYPFPVYTEKDRNRWGLIGVKWKYEKQVLTHWGLDKMTDIL